MRRILAGRWGLFGCMAFAAGAFAWAAFDDPVLRVGRIAQAMSRRPAAASRQAPDYPAWVDARVARLLDDPIARMQAGIMVEPSIWLSEHAPGFVGPPSPGSPGLADADRPWPGPGLAGTSRVPAAR